ncbi:MAG: tRNA dihydrouridine synthase DusB [Candidatus Izemoplasmatales bacterium]|nr:tRNA dihydrouridine synthase DusB [Candidatus Izemoplasmatales bacterium]
MKWKIGNIEINNQIVVAPMAGVTDPSYRRILKEFGAGLLYTEMISDKGILYKNEKTLEMIDTKTEEKPIAIQLFGSDPESMGKAAAYVSQNSLADIIDINFGCPVQKVIKGGAGVKLMQDEERSKEIITAVIKATNKPVTIKIRSGWDLDNINAISIAKIAETAGVSAIAIHPRTKTQLYSGKSDWQIIKDIKENVKIPVIGNGDIHTPEDALEMIKTSGCDAVMIGRGILGKPWLIKQTLCYLNEGKYTEHITLKERKETIIKHLDLLVKARGEHLAVLEMRSHGPWYIKGLKDSQAMKVKLVKASTVVELVGLIEDYFDYLYNSG